MSDPASSQPAIGPAADPAAELRVATAELERLREARIASMSSVMSPSARAAAEQEFSAAASRYASAREVVDSAAKTEADAAEESREVRRWAQEALADHKLSDRERAQLADYLPAVARTFGLTPAERGHLTLALQDGRSTRYPTAETARDALRQLVGGEAQAAETMRYAAAAWASLKERNPALHAVLSEAGAHASPHLAVVLAGMGRRFERRGGGR